MRTLIPVLFPVILIGLAGSAPEARALPRVERAPKVIARWVDSEGALETQHTGVLSAEWRWHDEEEKRASKLDDPDPFVPPARPSLFVVLETRALPAHASIEGTRGDGAFVSAVEVAVGGDPRLHRVTVKLHAEIAYIDFDVRAQGLSSRKTLVLTTHELAPKPLLHPSCRGFKITRSRFPQRLVGRHLYVAASCTEDDAAYYLHFFKSADARWAYTGTDTAKTELLYRLDRASPKVADEGTFFTLRTRDVEGRLYELDVASEHSAPTGRKTRRWRDAL